MKNLNRFLACLCLALFTLSPSQGNSAEQYLIIVPTSPGSAPDLFARKLIQLMPNNQAEFRIENYPGANGIIATEKFINASEKNIIFFAPDSVVVINPFIYKHKFQLWNQSIPIAKVAENEFYLFVNSKDKSNNLEDFLKSHRSQEIKFGSGGSGSQSEILFDRLKYVTAAKMINIPYKSNSDAAIALARGEVDIIASGSAAKILMQSGTIRPLIRLSKFSSNDMATVPTITTHFPSLSTTPWFAFFAGKKMTRGSLDYFISILQTTLNSDECKMMMKELGFNIDYLQGSDFVSFLKMQTDYYDIFFQTKNRLYE